MRLEERNRIYVYVYFYVYIYTLNHLLTYLFFISTLTRLEGLKKSELLLDKFNVCISVSRCTRYAPAAMAAVLYLIKGLDIC
jgi:hypothetical protein